MHLLLAIIYQAQHRPIERDYEAGRWDIRETVEQREDHRERNMETEEGGYEREQGSTIRFFFLGQYVRFVLALPIFSMVPGQKIMIMMIYLFYLLF